MEYLIFSVGLFLTTAAVLAFKSREPAVRLVRIEDQKNQK